MLGELPVTPLVHLDIQGFRWLYVKDESAMPHGTFKDRLAHCAVKRHRDADVIAAISYGNTAIALVRTIHEASRTVPLRAKATIFLPRGYRKWTLGPSSLGTTLGAEEVLAELQRSATILETDLGAGLLDDAELRALACAARQPCDVFVNITEGTDVPAYVGVIRESVEQLGRPPDICLVPYGAGILCNEVRDFLRPISACSVVPLSVASPASRAPMLYGPVWLDVERLGRDGVAQSRHRSPDRTGAPREPYEVHGVSEDEILRGVEVARSLGISAEPSGAVGFGVLHRLSDLVPGFRPDKHTVLIINTGNGIDGFHKGCA